MSRITVYQKLFCYNTIAFKKIEKKIYMQKIHIYYIRSCKFILNPKFYHFFFNYEEESNLKDIIYYCHKFLKWSVEQPWGLVCTDNASKLFREWKRNTEADLDTNNSLKIQLWIKNYLHSELTFLFCSAVLMHEQAAFGRK